MIRSALFFSVIAFSNDIARACDQHPWQVCQPMVCGEEWYAKHGVSPYYLPGTGGSVPANLNAPTFDSKNMRLQSQLPLNQMGGGVGSSLYGWVDPQTKKEYALMGRSNGLSIVDITTPTKPIWVANVPKQPGTQSTSWREPKVYKNTMYIGVDGTDADMQIVDLTRVRNYSGSVMTLTPDSYYDGVSRIHTLAINKETGYLYAMGTNVGSGGLHIMNVGNNPANPTHVANWANDGYTHEAQILTYNGPDAAYRGHEISLSFNGKTGPTTDTFSIIDLTNKSNITRLSTKSYSQAGYIHQGWITNDHQYVFVDDELDETAGFTDGKRRTHLFDIRDLNNPVYKGFVEDGVTIDHNMYERDGFLFQSDYTDGLQVFKIGNLASNNPKDWLRKVAFFDTYPADDSMTFNGAWNNYPFFPSGNIAISDINGGLFVVKMTQRAYADFADFPVDFGVGGVVIPDSPSALTVPEPTLLGVVSMATLGLLRRSRRNCPR